MSRPERDPEGPLRLLELGLSWPLDSYVVDKLEGLAARGVRVTAVVRHAADQTPAQLRGVQVLDQARWDEPALAMLPALACGCTRLAFASPGSLIAATRAAAKHPAHKLSRRGLLTFARRLRMFVPLAPLKPDVVHFEWNPAATEYRTMIDHWRCPAVVSCHGSDVNVRPHLPGGASFKRALRASFAAAQAVHCVSQTVASQATTLGMDPSRSRVIPLGVDTSRFRPADRKASASGLRVISVGQLRWIKGHEYALRAMQQLINCGVPSTLELIGGDPTAALGEESERPRIERAVREHGLEGCVRLRGRIAHDDVRRALHDADVLLHMSVSEGLGMAVLEAMASGLPTVVSDAGGLSEAVRDGVDGFVVPARAPAEAAAALKALYEDPALREKMGAAGRRRAVERFAFDRQLDEFADLYADVVARSPTKPAISQSNESQAAPPPDVPATGPELRLLSIGPWDWMERYDCVMAAVRALLDDGRPCRYRIVGSGPCRDALWFERYQLGLRDHVEIVEDVPASDAHLEWADVLIDASLAPGDWAHRSELPVIVPRDVQSLVRQLSERIALRS